MITLALFVWFSFWDASTHAALSVCEQIPVVFLLSLCFFRQVRPQQPLSGPRASERGGLSSFPVIQLWIDSQAGSESKISLGYFWCGPGTNLKHYSRNGMSSEKKSWCTKWSWPLCYVLYLHSNLFSNNLKWFLSGFFEPLMPACQPSHVSSRCEQKHCSQGCVIKDNSSKMADHVDDLQAIVLLCHPSCSSLLSSASSPN